jgi:Xaa-Pro aminopeptidase
MILNGAIADAILADFEAAIRPGVREYELLAVLNDSLLRSHGEFMFTRLVASGTNTNPWMSEAHDKLVQPGDLVGIDTDANGYEGYVLDVSRTFLCGDEGTPGQKEAYRIAYDCVNGMRELVQPGMSFEEFAHKAPQLPKPYRNGRYNNMVHQAGIEDEGPSIAYPDDERRGGNIVYPKRTLRENMVLCLECYAGKEGAPYGVKLEDQVLVTKAGAVALNTYPFEKKLL